MRVYTLRFGTLAQAFSHENIPARIHLPSTSQANGPPGSPWRRQRADGCSAGTKETTMPTLSVLLAGTPGLSVGDHTYELQLVAVDEGRAW